MTQLKDLFIESIVEKDQEINIMSLELHEMQNQAISFENLIEDMKIQMRTQALEYEDKETHLIHEMDRIKTEIEEQFMHKFIEEIKTNEEKEAKIMQEYRELEEKTKEYDSKITEKDLEIKSFHRENTKLYKEIEGLRENIIIYEKNIEEMIINRKTMTFEEINKENQYKKLLDGEKDKSSLMEKNLLENSKKVMSLEAKIQLLSLKNDKKKQKIREEREKSEEIRRYFESEFETLRKKYTEKENEWNNEKNKLQREIHTLREEKNHYQFRRRRPKEYSLGDEFKAFESYKEIDFKDPKALFERIGGREIAKSKFSEFEDILEKLKENFEGNDEIIEEFEPFIENLKKVLNKIFRETGDLRKNVEEITKEKEVYKAQFEEILRKYEENSEKQKNQSSFFNFGIPFLRR